jgi:hypothetical protein
MAMKIGEHYEYSKIKIRDWEKFANIAQISFPILKKNICEMSQKILIQMPDKKKNENIADVVALIENRCNNTLDNF